MNPNPEERETVEWWRGRVVSLTALVDAHFDFPFPLSATERLRQVQAELHNMVAAWPSDDIDLAQAERDEADDLATPPQLKRTGQ